MAALTDLVNKAQSALKDSLEELKSKEETARSNREASHARSGRAASESSELRPRREKVQSDIRTTQEEISRLETRISDLERKIAGLREEDQHLTESNQKLRKEQDQAVREQTSAQEALEKLQAERGKLSEKFRNDCRLALRTHLSGCGKALLAERTRKDSGRAGREAAARLQVARAADPEVANHFDHREEIKGILATARVPALRQTLEKELQAVEKELDRRFPGALSAEPMSSDPELEELYRTQSPDGRWLLLLPVDPGVWDSLEAGRHGSVEELAACITWALGRQLGPIASSLEVICFGNPEILAINMGDNAPGLDQVEVHWGDLSCTFFITALPELVEEAFHGKDRAS